MQNCRILSLLFFLLLLPYGSASAEDSVHHYSVGDLEIMAIKDADVSMAKKLLPDLDKYPDFSAIFDHGPVPAVDQTFYLQNGDHKILIDSGWGQDLAVKGNTANILAKEGIDPAQITDILLTHMDHDHIGGLLENGKPVYPNATLWISRPEYEAWINGGISNRPDSSIELAKKVVGTYKVKQFNFGDELLPGISSVDATGHTPGHTAYDIKSGADKMTIAGDVMHIAQVQLARPELSTVYDIDQQKAAATRQRLLQRAAREKSLFAGMHFPMISDVREIPDNGFVMKQPR